VSKTGDAVSAACEYIEAAHDNGIDVDQALWEAQQMVALENQDSDFWSDAEWEIVTVVGGLICAEQLKSRLERPETAGGVTKQPRAVPPGGGVMIDFNLTPDRAIIPSLGAPPWQREQRQKQTAQRLIDGIVSDWDNPYAHPGDWVPFKE
jgi:hypothetical protein